jgi:5-methylcytosine-specific restriction endonuclease McrA
VTWTNTTPHNTPAERKRILKRDRGICHVCGQPGANEVDHVIPLCFDGPDTDDNKAAIHGEPCHRSKTAAESKAAKDRLPQRKRPIEAHPGIIVVVTRGGGG